jgi:phage terminase large subunit-like protein
LPLEERRERLSRLSERELGALWYDWGFWARPAQMPPPGQWRTWFIKAGRGFGKTRTGAETIRRWVEEGRYGRITFVSGTAADVRDFMVEGESGILAVSPPWDYPHYEPSKRQITWNNGAIAKCYSAEDPDALRGAQQDVAWSDEPAKWKRATETWDNLQFGLRLGSDPRNVATGTPKPTALVQKLLRSKTTVVTGGSSYENAENLAQAFIDEVIKPYEGTRLGRQEINAELLEDTPGALWTYTLIEANRRELPARDGDDGEGAEGGFLRVVVAIDPAVSSGEGSSETGIIVAGVRLELDRSGEERTHGYILEDVSLRGSPLQWATAAVNAYERWQADRIVGEVNNGGDLVESNLRSVNRSIPFRKVHASRGKRVRAEPVKALYEQGRVHHVHGASLDVLEDQMCSTDLSLPRDPENSPDHLDAMVWAVTDLMLEPSSGAGGILI